MKIPGKDKVESLLAKHKDRKKEREAHRVTLVRAMQYAGGYEELMALPISAYVEIVKAINTMDEWQRKKEEAMFGGKNSKKPKKPRRR